MIMITMMMMMTIIILRIIPMIMATNKEEQLDANCACLACFASFFSLGY